MKVLISICAHDTLDILHLQVQNFNKALDGQCYMVINWNSDQPHLNDWPPNVYFAENPVRWVTARTYLVKGFLNNIREARRIGFQYEYVLFMSSSAFFFRKIPIDQIRNNIGMWAFKGGRYISHNQTNDSPLKLDDFVSKDLRGKWDFTTYQKDQEFLQICRKRNFTHVFACHISGTSCHKEIAERMVEDYTDYQIKYHAAFEELLIPTHIYNSAPSFGLNPVFIDWDVYSHTPFDRFEIGRQNPDLYAFCNVRKCDRRIWDAIVEWTIT